MCNLLVEINQIGVNRRNIESNLEMKDVADSELEEGRKVWSEMRDACEKLKDFDRGLEKNFKKEFPGMGFNQASNQYFCLLYCTEYNQ